MSACPRCGWKPEPTPLGMLGPRCGRVLALDGRYERGGEAGDPGAPPRCGRPDGHRGPCRSEAALRRYRLASREWWEDVGRPRRTERRQLERERSRAA